MPNGIKKPADGGGIKWSTLTRKKRTITLENGDTTEEPVTLFNPAGSPIEYVGYEVELEKEVEIGGVKKKKIQVWVLVQSSIAPPPTVDLKGWCHGTTFDDGIYSPGGEAVPLILLAGWEEIECAGAKRGDIIVYYDKNGTVTHSATNNGDGTYTSKAGNAATNNADTKNAMDTMYKVPPGRFKCFRKK
jgi:hypothetical protein